MVGEAGDADPIGATGDAGGAPPEEGPPTAPRIGAFEVTVTLRNCRTGAVYNAPLFSKLQSNCWPSLEKLAMRLRALLQRWLVMDEGA